MSAGIITLQNPTLLNHSTTYNKDRAACLDLMYISHLHSLNYYARYTDTLLGGLPPCSYNSDNSQMAPRAEI